MLITTMINNKSNGVDRANGTAHTTHCIRNADLRDHLLKGTCYEILEQDSFNKLYSILA